MIASVRTIHGTGVDGLRAGDPEEAEPGDPIEANGDEGDYTLAGVSVEDHGIIAEAGLRLAGRRLR
jgi:hypothetical protein